MGIMQCVTSKDKYDLYSHIEKSINNKNSTLDIKIYEEYYSLKNYLKPTKTIKDKDTNSKNNSINHSSQKEKMKKFIKWYFMSHPNQNPKNKLKENPKEYKNLSYGLTNNSDKIEFDKNNSKHSIIIKIQSYENVKNLENMHLSPLTSNNPPFSSLIKRNENEYFDKDNNSLDFINKKVQFSETEKSNNKNINTIIKNKFNDRLSFDDINKEENFISNNIRNSMINFSNKNNYASNSFMKIKLNNKNDLSVKILPKIDINNLENENNLNQDNSNFSSKNFDLKKKSTSDSTNKYNLNNSNNISYKSHNDDNINNKSISENFENKNYLSYTKTNTLQKDDSLSENNSYNPTEINITNKAFYNSTTENEFNSNSIFQTLNIFEDSNIIESNLRLYHKINNYKFCNKVERGGPPESFRWISWLICSNLPIERSKSFYLSLLNTPLKQEIDIQIKKDLNRTLTGFNFNNILDETQVILYNILKAFSNIDPEVSYCQGMNFIVGFLLIISDFNELDTFYLLISLFSNTYSDNIGIRGFYLEGFPFLNAYVYIYMDLFSKNCPILKKHFDNLEIPEEVWISKWFRTLFTLTLPFNFCVRIWDCILVNGLDFLLNFTLALMKYMEQDLLKLNDLFDVIEYFKKMGPFFNLENEGDEKAKEESLKFIENFDIEEILKNSKKIKIKKSLLKEQFEIYELKNNLLLENYKIKYQTNLNNFPDSLSKNDNCTINNYFINSDSDIIHNQILKNESVEFNCNFNQNNPNDETITKYSTNNKNFDYERKKSSSKIINNFSPKREIKSNENKNDNLYHEKNYCNTQLNENNFNIDNSNDNDIFNLSENEYCKLDIKEKLSYYNFKTNQILNSKNIDQ